MEIFPKGLTLGFGKKLQFFQPFFLGNIGRKNMFNDIPEPKNDIVRHKKRTSNSPKMEIFSKGLTHGFGQKMAIFYPFF